MNNILNVIPNEHEKLYNKIVVTSIMKMKGR
jgi:hypothetical protein